MADSLRRPSCALCVLCGCAFCVSIPQSAVPHFRSSAILFRFFWPTTEDRGLACSLGLSFLHANDRLFIPGKPRTNFVTGSPFATPLGPQHRPHFTYEH